MAPKSKDLKSRVYAQVVCTAGGCWEWQGCRQRQGYGVLSVNNKQARVHRLAWEIHNGPIPEGLCVLHQCDNPPCVNPAHLFLGTHADNVRDMCAKGRNGNVKLTEQDVLAICADPRSHRQIAKQYGISDSQVGSIKLRERWKHLDVKRVIGWRGHKFGVDHYRAKLTEEDVLAIRADPRSGGEIAKQYGIDQSQARRIKRREVWQRLEVASNPTPKEDRPDG